MISKSGTGAHASETIITSALPAGFYSIGIRLEAAGIPSGAALALYLTSPHPTPAVAVASQAQPNSSAFQGPFYLQPGDEVAFSVTPVGNYGSNPPASWAAKFWLYQGDDVS